MVRDLILITLWAAALAELAWLFTAQAVPPRHAHGQVKNQHGRK